MRSLVDNHKDDRYCYQILVFTGHRRDAGTKSKVHLIVAGDENESEVRTLCGSDRKMFERGGIDGFVMSVSK